MLEVLIDLVMDAHEVLLLLHDARSVLLKCGTCLPYGLIPSLLCLAQVRLSLEEPFGDAFQMAAPYGVNDLLPLNQMLLPRAECLNVRDAIVKQS